MSLPSRQKFPHSEKITPNDTLSFLLSTHPFTDPAICQVRPFRQRAHSAQKKKELFFCHSVLCGDRLRNLERNMPYGVPCAPYTHTHFILPGPLGWQSMILRGMAIKA